MPLPQARAATYCGAAIWSVRLITRSGGPLPNGKSTSVRCTISASTRFAWAIFEPAPGKFEFDWMDRALDVMNRNGISAVLATPTASVPPWLYQLHPDVLTGNDIGLYTYGGRKGYNTNSPNYLAASARVTNALAEHYGHHPAVIGWQLDNEPGHPPQAYDPVSEQAFQVWLRFCAALILPFQLRLSGYRRGQKALRFWF